MDIKDYFERGDPVHLVYDNRRQWLKKVETKEFHSNYGMINLEDLIGKPYGHILETNKGKRIRAYNPEIKDWMRSFEHQGQIIYEKDAAYIAFMLDIKSGSVIYEAGTGSGSLTAYLSQLVGHDGKIVTHDIRKEAIKAAKKNLSKLKISNVDFHERDVIKDGFINGEADGLVLDMVDPWKVLAHVKSVLQNGKKLVIFIPSYNQIEKTYLALRENNFKEIRAVELIEREIQLKEGAIRPNTRMIGHTGFLLEAININN